jgi:signal transduction histidine kinase
MQDDYLAHLSHDLRTPLATVLGYAELLLRQLEEAALERARRSAEAIVTSGATMARMLQDVLDGHQLQAGHAELQLAPLDLVQLVIRGIDHNLLPAERTRIEVQAVELLPIVADAIRMERVIVNLLTNACKYSAPADPVVVRVSRMGRNAVISVTDQGVGVDADDLAHLFEKHYRAKTAGMTQGVGLGLFGSRLIVEAHGGRIWAQSAVDAGSTFLVSLPAGEPPPSANEP